VGTKSFGLSHEDIQDKDDWRLKQRGQPLTQVYQENGCYSGVCIFYLLLAGVKAGCAHLCWVEGTTVTKVNTTHTQDKCCPSSLPH